jgi:hypothetical protein
MSYTSEDIIDYTFVDLKGLTIWLKDPEIFARCYPKNMKVFLLNSQAEKEYAQGLRLKFQCKGFSVAELAPMTKMDGLNEFSVWLDKSALIQLRDFLNKLPGLAAVDPPAEEHSVTQCSTTQQSETKCCYDCAAWCGRCSKYHFINKIARDPACINFEPRKEPIL